MSHRKFEAPRHGNLAFLPKQRCKKTKATARSFPVDDPSKKPHLTAFIGFKAGMTHIAREVDRTAAMTNKETVVEGATVIETPEMYVVGLVGYAVTPRGRKQITTVWASHLSDEIKRSFYKNWHVCKKKAFSKYENNPNYEEVVKDGFERIQKYCNEVRVIAHTQPSKVTGLEQRKGRMMEIKINGGNVAEKIEFCRALFEKPINVNMVFQEHAALDVIGITKGRGCKGVITRWGVTRLQRKTHRGNRRVACIGSWHPSNVRYTVARHGQHGYHHRTEINKRILRIADGSSPTSGNTNSDVGNKSINPMGGFVRYGLVKNDFVLLKGCCVGPKKRLLVLRHPLHARTTRKDLEPMDVKFIDTSSKMGHGRFQTSEEKKAFYA